ncbi:DctP TRAP-type C4-dicarboxylate transport system, periplasmic component [uncultured Caudovirales phage]|uniref:DctP TRAP-type C4-dicarboxylate transport system, periplasmic component n=1 Tax=uncultured Caudovirales phage TaxID=2100421 RepID=A0A6J5LVV3_9CAUD|nr:DctP TRAP-type C4-dicarboxylate transport system, periplasmic component [uncultured Caudovirales phage]
MSTTRTIRWVLAHEPYDLFLRAAEKFASEVAEKTNNEIKIEVLGLTEYVDLYNNGQALDRYKIRELVDNGTIEMSQMYTTTLGLLDQDMFVLDMPFIFRDHEHAARVLDGEIGQELMDSLASKSNIKGLAFTYSGGFRAIIGNRVIESIDDMKGMTVRVAHCPVAEDTIRALGAEPVVMPIEQLRDAIGSHTVDAGESTYPRIYGMKQNETAGVINHTEHSLFLTTLIMNKGLWNDLTVEQQQIFRDAALAAAHIERAESLEDVEITRDRAEKDGIRVVDLSDQTKQQFKQATQSIYSKYQNYFSNNLINRIQQQ